MVENSLQTIRKTWVFWFKFIFAQFAFFEFALAQSTRGRGRLVEPVEGDPGGVYIVLGLVILIILWASLKNLIAYLREDESRRRLLARLCLATLAGVIVVAAAIPFIQHQIREYRFHKMLESDRTAETHREDHMRSLQEPGDDHCTHLIDTAQRWLTSIEEASVSASSRESSTENESTSGGAPEAQPAYFRPTQRMVSRAEMACRGKPKAEKKIAQMQSDLDKHYPLDQ